MNESEMGPLKARLLSLRSGYLDTIRNIEQTGLSMSARDSIKELSMADNHPADVATETFERSKDLGLKMNARRMVDRIDKALELMDKGQYGVCEGCGRFISDERLRAVPYATRCIKCQELADSRIYQGRPLEEEIVPMPFGKKAPGGGFAGEEIWEEVSVGGFAGENDAPGPDDDHP